MTGEGKSDRKKMEIPNWGQTIKPRRSDQKHTRPGEQEQGTRGRKRTNQRVRKQTKLTRGWGAGGGRWEQGSANEADVKQVWRGNQAGQEHRNAVLSSWSVSGLQALSVRWRSTFEVSHPHLRPSGSNAASLQRGDACLAGVISHSNFTFP